MLYGAALDVKRKKQARREIQDKKRKKLQNINPMDGVEDDPVAAHVTVATIQPKTVSKRGLPLKRAKRDKPQEHSDAPEEEVEEEVAPRKDMYRAFDGSALIAIGKVNF